MGTYKLPPKVKLVVGLLGRNVEMLSLARKALGKAFGAEEVVMDSIPFIWTQYYARELGNSPVRSFVSYEEWIARETLVDIKRFTNILEEDLAEDGPEGKVRRVNIDPGYVTLGQFFLATTKDQRHRVYVRDGIFVEPTLFFQDGGFHPFEWTYPDYRSPEYRLYFGNVRSKLVYQLRNEGAPYSRRKSIPAPLPTEEGLSEAGSDPSEAKGGLSKAQAAPPETGRVS